MNWNSLRVETEDQNSDFLPAKLYSINGRPKLHSECARD